MRYFFLTVLVLVLSYFWVASPVNAQAPETKPVPKFSGETLPTPPMQTAKWESPETTLPEKLVSATEQLFDQGLADPRGCDYREIEVVVRYVSHGERILKTHGWVLPTDGATRNRFAVCWNGLVYPVVTVGEKADVRSDTKAMLKAEKQRRENLADVENNRRRSIVFRQIREESGVDHTTWRVLIKLCMLLRLGEFDLAEQSWSLWESGVEKDVNNQKRHMEDPYYLLAHDWIWSLFDRAFCAHMHGDHGLSLASCTKLIGIVEPARKTVEERGFTTGISGEIADLPFRFIEPLPALMSEQRRRLDRMPYETALERGAEFFESNEKFIAALIRDLENVAARQWGQPGGISLEDDPIVAALISQGADAIGPLIECVETDTRLTQSVSYHRDFFSNRRLRGVDEAASVAISEILETRQLPRPYSVSMPDRDEALQQKKRIADEIRAYWIEVKDIPVTRRWYDVLANDEATTAQWLEAARQITQPISFKTEDRTMRGEVLREISDPSVTELIAKRVRKLTLKETAKSSTELFRMHKACRLSLDLATWDLEGSLPTLREQMSDCQRAFVEVVETYGITAAVLGVYIADITLKRAEAGDDTALDEYVEWVRHVTPRQLDSYVSDAFEPLWIHPTHAAIAEVSDWLFNSDISPWNPLITAEKWPGAASALDILRQPMINNSAFRQQLLRGLADTKKAGSVLIRDSDSILITLTMGRQMGHTVRQRAGDPPVPPVGTEMPIRICDYIAYELQRHDGPAFGIYWPEAERDVVIAKSIEFVKNYQPPDGGE